MDFMFWSLMTYIRDMAYSCEVCGGDEDRRCTCDKPTNRSYEYCRRCESTICNCSEDDKSAEAYYSALDEAQREADYGPHQDD